MIQTVDFVPQKQKGGLFKSDKIEAFKDVVTAMNDWRSKNDVNIISIETVVLPNIHDTDEEGSEDTELWTGNASSTSWHQIIRIWFTSK